MIVAVTGHRPEKLGGYSEESQLKLIEFTKEQLKKLNPEKLIQGMALGFDQASAIAALELQIPVVAAIPFNGQEKIWPAESQNIYNMILSHQLVDSYIVSPGGFQSWKMHVRNEWMVNNSDVILALYDGSKTGGTKACIEYAKKKNKQIINIWDEWTKYDKN